jgi:hypothetical protein
VDSAGLAREERAAGGAKGAAERDKVEEKATGGARSHEVGWRARHRKPRDASLATEARTGGGDASARTEAVAECGGRQRELVARF